MHQGADPVAEIIYNCFIYFYKSAQFYQRKIRWSPEGNSFLFVCLENSEKNILPSIFWNLFFLKPDQKLRFIGIDPIKNRNEQRSIVIQQFKQKRFTEDELLRIKALYSGENGVANLKLLRKVFFPQYDYEAPLGQTVHSLWMGLDQLAQMAPADRELAILSQIRLNQHIERHLIELSVLANQNVETEEEKKAKARRDSSK